VTKFGSRYWDSVASLSAGSAESRDLWRMHMQAVYRALLQRWLPCDPTDSAPSVAKVALKTDLYEEALGHGLLPDLCRGEVRVVGMDLSWEIVRRARAQLSQQGCHPLLVTCDARHLPFVARSFAVVVSFSTLDHFTDASDLFRGLEELTRVMRDDGTAIVTLDNRANPVIALRNRFSHRTRTRLRITPYYVGATYTPGELVTALRSLDMNVVDMEAVLHCPRIVVIWVLRVVLTLGGWGGKAILRLLRRFEGLARWPTRYRTGYYLAFRAEKRALSPDDAVAGTLSSHTGKGT